MRTAEVLPFAVLAIISGCARVPGRPLCARRTRRVDSLPCIDVAAGAALALLECASTARADGSPFHRSQHDGDSQHDGGDHHDGSDEVAEHEEHSSEHTSIRVNADRTYSIGNSANACKAGLEALHASEVYANFVEDNSGCIDGRCDTGKLALARECDALPHGGQVCSTAMWGIDANSTEHEWTVYTCLPTRCQMTPDTTRAVELLEAGWQQANAWSSCGGGQYAGPNVVSLLFQLVCFLCVLGFAYNEKTRRWGRMGQKWPAAPGRGAGALRTTLCGCCGCSRLCWSSFCCPQIMSLMNRAELDDRAFGWLDVCCFNAVCATAYFNRRSIRERLDAPDEPCKDCLATFCCLPCVVGQHATEIEMGLPEHGARAGGAAVVAVPAAGHIVVAGMPVNSSVVPTAGVNYGYSAAAPSAYTATGHAHAGVGLQ